MTEKANLQKATELAPSETISKTEKTYDAYAHYLWHLCAIGMFDHLDDKPRPDTDGALNIAYKTKGIDIIKDIWGNLGHSTAPGTADDYSTRVAIIDVGVYKHPAFQERIKYASGLATNSAGMERHGNVTGNHKDDNVTAKYEEALRKWNLTKAEQNMISDVWDKGVLRQDLQKKSRDQHASHGTAAAGLVGAFHPIYPKTFESLSQSTAKTEGASNTQACERTDTRFKGKIVEDTQKTPLLYFGVDPWCKIIPITTSHAPEPREMIWAFLQAYFHSDVILFPRDIADPIQMGVDPYAHQENGTSYPDTYKTLIDSELDKLKREKVEEWKVLQKLILAISNEIPVVCAAGNSGESQAIYPASLAGNSSGSVISVGAVSYEGFRSGYSNYGEGQITVVAPSGDSEVISKHQLRVDHLDKHNKRHNWCGYIEDLKKESPNIQIVPHSPQQILTTDIPGKWGYVGELDDDEQFDDTELAEYSGTSAASAIVAGVISLYINKRRLSQNKTYKESTVDISGKDLKNWLERGEGVEMDIAKTHVGVSRTMSADKNNTTDVELFNAGSTLISDSSLERWFGRGLISVRKVLN